MGEWKTDGSLRKAYLIHRGPMSIARYPCPSAFLIPRHGLCSSGDSPVPHEALAIPPKPKDGDSFMEYRKTLSRAYGSTWQKGTHGYRLQCIRPASSLSKTREGTTRCRLHAPSSPTQWMRLSRQRCGNLPRSTCRFAPRLTGIGRHRFVFHLISRGYFYRRCG